MILNEIRCKCFLLICGSSVVKSGIFKCVICRKLTRRIREKVIADLAKDRYKVAPPLTYCAVDIFGPFTVRVERSDMKYYGDIFTFLASRDVHTEITHSLDTDSFIQALKKLIAC